MIWLFNFHKLTPKSLKNTGHPGFNLKMKKNHSSSAVVSSLLNRPPDFRRSENLEKAVMSKSKGLEQDLKELGSKLELKKQLPAVQKAGQLNVLRTFRVSVVVRRFLGEKKQ